MTLAEIRVLRIEIQSASGATDKRELLIRFQNFTFYLCFDVGDAAMVISL